MSYASSIIAQNKDQFSLDDLLDGMEKHTDMQWKEAALNQVRELCRTQKELTTDDVWPRLEILNVSTSEPRAMGYIMRKAVRNGWCRASGQYIKSERPECHSRPISVYISRFYS